MEVTAVWVVNGDEQIIKMISEKVGDYQKYPNLYTDIAYSFAYKSFRKYFFNNLMKGPDAALLKDRILFGTDWYLTLLDSVDYVKYCKEAKEALDGFDNSLWFRFTQYNPHRFYRLGDEDQIGRIAKNIIAEGKQMKWEIILKQ